MYTNEQLDHFAKFITCFGNRGEMINKDLVSIPFKTSIGPAKSPIQEEIIRINEIIGNIENPNLIQERDWIKNKVSSAYNTVKQGATDAVNWATGNNLWATFTGTFFVRLRNMDARRSDRGSSYLDAKANITAGIRNLKVHSAINYDGAVVADIIPLYLQASATIVWVIQNKQGQARLIISPQSISTPVGDTKLYKSGDKLILNANFGYDVPGFGRTGFYIEGENSCLTVNMFQQKFTLTCLGDKLTPINNVFCANGNTLLSSKMVNDALNPKVPISSIFPDLQCK
jgi:hypothetical protein